MKVYLIDSSNANKVINLFATKREAKEYIKNKYYTTNTNETLKEFKENFYFVPEKELKEKAKKYGSRIYNYFT